MRWHFVDRVTAFDPWRLIEGCKAVSLEEYYLLAPLGREGVLPESLVIECCVELVRWLVAASSSFEQSVALTGIERFAFEREVGMGHLLRSNIRIEERSPEGIEAECQAVCDGRTVASGRLMFTYIVLDECSEPEELSGLWRELCGTA